MPPPVSKAQASFFGAIAGGKIKKKGFSKAQAKNRLEGTSISELPDRISMAKKKLPAVKPNKLPKGKADVSKMNAADLRAAADKASVKRWLALKPGSPGYKKMQSEQLKRMPALPNMKAKAGEMKAATKGKQTPAPASVSAHNEYRAPSAKRPRPSRQARRGVTKPRPASVQSGSKGAKGDIADTIVGNKKALGSFIDKWIPRGKKAK